MKIETIMSEAGIGLTTRKWKTADPLEISEAIDSVKNSEIFKKLAEIADFDSTQIELRHGVLGFTCYFHMDNLGSIMRYTINYDGQIRSSRVNPWKKTRVSLSPSRLQSALEPKTLLDRYLGSMNMLYSRLKRLSDKVRIQDPYAYRKASSLKEFNLPKIYPGNLNISGNSLIDLVGSPEEVHGDFVCMSNLEKPLSLIGSPKYVKGVFSLKSTGIQSLEGLTGKYGSITLAYTGLSSLRGIEKIEGATTIIIPSTIESGFLKLISVKDLEEVIVYTHSWKLRSAVEIINKHLKSERDLINCKRDLINGNLKEFTV